MATPTTLYRAVWEAERQLVGDRKGYHRVGHDGWPNKEVVRFRSSQNLGFAGQDLVTQRAWRSDDGDDGVVQHDLTVDLMGLTGARGAMPACFTERVLQLVKQKSPATRDFLDLFNHRLVSLLYRSWEKTQPAVHQEREEEDIFTYILKTLTGCEENWQLYYGAAFARHARSGSMLRAVLEDITGMPVDVRAMQGEWAQVSPDDQSRLPDDDCPKGQFANLGGAILGSRVWIADKGVEVVFRPKSREELVTVLPGGAYSKTLLQVTQRLVSGQTRVRYRLSARAAHLTHTILGQQGKLGADSFIGARPESTKMVEVSFKPSQGKD
ncbi:type VI secretion system baseplate subunit TssG [Marinobacter xestospongiae]|uniref:Type VI secretion system baseplate subunit TssG n=1 Tax=Marinobacter xestospongiae TaxID=994319 RepID=A0ABU3VYY4_9GAMM|nr:type VI secretion system baseplate subunit TssG [Marinobacter xestospongiae]MDV2078921.1 type VI secretion system baseplate subunit TssG [Marinobacter xestospongiae]